eukprot:3939533-Alexandrium_andersonii.AAC.1
MRNQGCIVQSPHRKGSEHVGSAGKPRLQSEGYRFGSTAGFSSAARCAGYVVRARTAAVSCFPSG